MKLITSLVFIVGVVATMFTVSGAGLSPRPLTGELIHARCFILANGSLGNEYKSCIADDEKNNKPIIFALLTPEGDVYLLVEQKGISFEGLRLGEQIRVSGVRSIMVGSMKKMK